MLIGPTVQGRPLCVWQRHFRQRHDIEIKPLALTERILAWFRPQPVGPPGLEFNWDDLDEADRTFLLLTLMQDRSPAVRSEVAHLFGRIQSDLAAEMLVRFIE